MELITGVKQREDIEVFGHLNVYSVRYVYYPVFHDSFALKPNLKVLCLTGYQTLSSGFHMFIVYYFIFL